MSELQKAFCQLEKTIKSLRREYETSDNSVCERAANQIQNALNTIKIAMLYDDPILEEIKAAEKQRLNEFLIETTERFRDAADALDEAVSSAVELDDLDGLIVMGE